MPKQFQQCSSDSLWFCITNVGVFSLRPRIFICFKPYLITNLRKWLHIADNLYISVGAGWHIQHLYESLDLTSGFKNNLKLWLFYYFAQIKNCLWCHLTFLISIRCVQWTIYKTVKNMFTIIAILIQVWKSWSWIWGLNTWWNNDLTFFGCWKIEFYLAFNWHR